MRLWILSVVCWIGYTVPVWATPTFSMDSQQLQQLQQRVELLERQQAEPPVQPAQKQDFTLSGRIHLLFTGHEPQEPDALKVKLAKFQVQKSLGERDFVFFSLRASQGKDVTLEELYYNRSLWPGWSLQLGQMRLLQSLEVDKSSNWQAMANGSRVGKIYNLFGSTGAGVALHMDKSWLKVLTSVYGNSVHDKPAEGTRLGWTLRAFNNVWAQRESVLHLGINARWDVYHYPEDYLVDHNPFRHLQKVGVEFALNHRAFNLQAEYLLGRLQPKKLPQEGYHTSGYYVEASYLLTGETKRYNPTKGTFSVVRIRNPLDQGGYGAWEVAARLSHADLAERGLDRGVYDEYTLGVNWLPLENLKVLLNFSHNRECQQHKAENSYNVVNLAVKFFF